MGKIAFVFSGQGAQKVGMGLSMYKNSKEANQLFNIAETIRPGTKDQCFESTDAELQITENTQPCLFATEIATSLALTEAGIKADMTAGFSLGELSAITYAQSLSFSEAFKLVMCRGKLMQQAAEQHNTSMVAVVRLSDEVIADIASKFLDVYPVNYNCPEQVSVAGEKNEIAKFSLAVKEAGGKAIPLKVNAAFHSPFMSLAAKSFQNEIAHIKFENPILPIYSNLTGEIYGNDMVKLLSSQIDHPVYWKKIVEGMIQRGTDTFFEIGPGKTLCGFIKRINPYVRTFSIEEYEDIELALLEVKV